MALMHATASSVMLYNPNCPQDQCLKLHSILALQPFFEERLNYEQQTVCLECLMKIQVEAHKLVDTIVEVLGNLHVDSVGHVIVFMYVAV